MKTSWRRFYRRVASVCLVGGATAWSSAVCYAQQIAFDSASDPVYADGWQGTVTNTEPMVAVGDNGGFGFKPWSFDNDYIFTNGPPIGIRDIDSSSPFNQVAPAWRIGTTFLPTEGKDITRAGRGLATPLQAGQSISVVMDPPSEGVFNDGLFFSLNTGGGSTCYYGHGCTKGTNPVGRFGISTYNFFDFDNYNRWGATDVEGYTPLFTSDTDAGMRLDFSLLTPNTFRAKMTPLDNPAIAFTWEGELDTPGGDSDADSDGDVDGGDFLTWQRNFGKSVDATREDGNANPPDDPGNFPPRPPSDDDVNGIDLAEWGQEFGNGAIDWIEFTHFSEESDPLLPTDWYIRSLEVKVGVIPPAMAAAVPEPSSVIVAAGLLGGLVGAQRWDAVVRRWVARSSEREADLQTLGDAAENER